MKNKYPSYCVTCRARRDAGHGELRKVNGQWVCDCSQNEKARAEAEAASATVAASRATDAEIDVPLPAGLSLLPYQKAGVAFIRERSAVLLGDEMGLGKTVQVIASLNSLPAHEAFPCLVLCPASLRLNWEREWRRWTTHSAARVTVVRGQIEDEAADVVVMNYDVAAKHADYLRRRNWATIVADECHYLKNPRAQRTVAILGKEDRRGNEVQPALAARRKIALSGTPLPNRPVELWPVVHWLRPDIFKSFWYYAKDFCNAYHNGYGWNFNGAKNLDRLQQKLRETCLIRRRKADVLTELPPKRRQIIVLPPNGAEAAVRAECAAWERHEALLTDLRAAVEVAKAEGEEAYRAAVERLRDAARAAFTEISRLRHATAVAKIPHVIDHVREALDGGSDKVVVWAHHHDVIAALRDGLAEYQPAVVTGETSLDTRQAEVDRFQSDPACRVFVGSITAAGVGLTLTAASHAVFAELDWVPGNVSQAEDRCHRIGQKSSVLIQHIVLDGSLDARMAQVLVEKQQVIEQALDAPHAAVEREAPAIPSAETPATADATPHSLTEVAAALGLDDTPERVHAALRYLAGVCDGAHAKDDAGFNRLDTAIGKRLASLPFLTPRQVALGLRLVRKYRRQLEHAGISLPQEGI